MNKSKSCVISSAPPEACHRIRRALLLCPWPDLPLVDSAKHLGILIGRLVTLDMIWNHAFTKAARRLQLAKPFLQTVSVRNRILFVNVFVISIFSYLSLFFIIPSATWKTFRRTVSIAVTPFHGGAYKYVTLVCLEQLYGIKPALRDVWAAGTSLLAVRSDFIHSTLNYRDLPSIDVKFSKHISKHRDAAAIDYWRGRHLEDGTLIPIGTPKSTAVYRSIVADVFLEEATNHDRKKVFASLTSHQPFTDSEDALFDAIVSNITNAKGVPPFVRFHQFTLIHNALATSRRMRHQNKLSLDQVPPCFFCGTEQDSLTHIYSSCVVVRTARAAFLSSLAPSCVLPLSLLSSFLFGVPPPTAPHIMLFNFATWSFRKQALASRSERDQTWTCNRIVELATGLVRNVVSKTKTKVKRPTASDDHNTTVASLPASSLICYTDGSSSPNPGPCGAGVSIFDQHNHTVHDAGAALGFGSNNIAELYALGICLSLLSQLIPLLLPPSAVIFCDSLFAINSASSTSVPKAHKPLVNALRAVYTATAALPCKIAIKWVKGHGGVGGNERVDRISKRYASLSSTSPPSTWFPSSSFFLSSVSPTHWPWGMSAPPEFFLSSLPRAVLTPPPSQITPDSPPGPPPPRRPTRVRPG